MKINTYLFFIFFAPISATAQSYSSKVIDQKTQKPIPFATIQLSEESGLITNEEGVFSFSWDRPITATDSIQISSMGYEKKRIALQKLTDSIIRLQPKAIDLGSAFISTKNLSIDEIMEEVVNRLPKNYKSSDAKKRLFFRHSDFSDFKKLAIAFKKSSIEELNKAFIDSLATSIPRKSSYYTEILADYYHHGPKNKLHIIKAAELYDKNNNGSVEELGEKMQQIFKDNVKSNSYLKIKSGWFGTKVQVDSILTTSEEGSEIKDEIKENSKEFKNKFHEYRKRTFNGLQRGLFFKPDPKMDLIDKIDKYQFTLRDYNSIDDQVVYIVDFEPKKNQDFKGTLYINTQDYAVMRIDYQNVNRLRNFKLLGLMYREHLYKGTTIFKKGTHGAYELKYLERTRGTLFGVDRPLKVIEKNKFVKGKRKQNELSLGIDLMQYHVDKYEIIVFDHKSISEDELKNIKENTNIKPTYLSQYDPSFWKGHAIIAPNAAIQQFKATASTALPEE